MKGTLAVTGDPEADRLLNTDPLALLLGMLLDQQVPMEWAFMAPHRLKERMGGVLDASKIASYDPDELAAIFKGPPALHRFPGSMAKRTQEMCRVIADEYDNDAQRVWAKVTDGKELFRRLTALPGYGKEKASIFTAILAKRMGVRPKGWEDHAGPFADATPRSVADIDSPETLQAVRAFKKAKNAEGKGKAD
jgi:uncharacterized HhH-GPD family protein